VGSLLIGDGEAIDKALRVRKVLGGGMRQAGYLAAAGLYALENNIDRLQEDHNKAREIGETLAQLEFVKKVEPIETNIVIFEVEESLITADSFTETLRKNDIHIISMGQGKLRMVTHLDYTDAMHEELLKRLKAL
jgi:threonine aldolase